MKRRYHSEASRRRPLRERLAIATAMLLGILLGIALTLVVVAQVGFRPVGGH